ncbi:EI24 domain-containing protein [Streptomyces sp. 549]|uniref:EI24 domain-containing protein n=1 Tax=Streptomyces sp. 549 TaxID=3049076 RepID=UPI0024C22621|nr:EI24 domain-containing protein [Streptomyces sp. 549]MDK1474219.1 EI24 domain-containing protein [Streptomyces sp. 549]
MSDLVAGLRYFGRGQRWVAGHGRWYGFGLLPGLIALLLYTGALVLLGMQAPEIAQWATPFADSWSAGWQSSLRTLFAALLFVAGLLLAVLTFTAVTLLIGDPFYESLSEHVEASQGSVPKSTDRPLWRELWISVCDSVYVLLRALAFVVPLFLLGFVPVIGQTVVPAIGFAVSGFFLTVELTSVALQRRDVPVRDRLARLRKRKALAVGFGVPLVLSFLVPLAAVFLMPGAVAGATLLVRDLLAESDGRPAAPKSPGGPWQADPPPSFGPPPPSFGPPAGPPLSRPPS